MIPKLLTAKNTSFPDVSLALAYPNGLLAMGGDLEVRRLLVAYQQGIFPWYMEGEPIMWWSPNPRAVLFLDELKISRSLLRRLRRDDYTVTIDQAFQQVIQQCAAPRPKEPDTWITPAMQEAYCKLHAKGVAHSIELWQQEQLIAGLYGVDCGRVFTGESMFSRKPDSSKIVLVYLVHYLRNYDYVLLDCQISNPFLRQFGTREISRAAFIDILKNGFNVPNNAWRQKKVLPRLEF